MSSIALAAVYASDNGNYRPYDHPYPQIIQAQDYVSISAIEDLYVELSKIDNRPPSDLRVTCRVASNSLIFVFATGRELAFSIPPEGAIEFADQRFASKDTSIAFNAVLRILKDLTELHYEPPVRYSQWSGKAYEKITNIDFDFGTKVLEIFAASNGPDDLERLYTVDLVTRDKAALFGPSLND